MHKGWQAGASSDADEVAALWRGRPDANIALAIQPGFVVLDLDLYKPGAAEALERFQHDLPATLEFRTARGGRHLIYATDRTFGNSPGTLPASIDARGVGGYIIGPGSVVDGKPYTVTTFRVPTRLPSVIEGMLSEKRDRAADADEPAPLVLVDDPRNVQHFANWCAGSPINTLATPNGEVAGPCIEGQGGNNLLAATGAMAHDYGLSEDVALNTALEHHNPRCDPPWDDDQYERHFMSGYRSATGQLGCRAPALDYARLFKPVAPPAEAVVADGGLPAGLFDITEAANRPAVPWIVDGVVQVGSYSAASGRSQSGKSFNELDLAACIATGEPHHGKAILKTGVVLYIVSEGYGQFVDNVKAWCQHRGRDFADLRGRFYVFDGATFLDDPKGQAELDKILKAIHRETGGYPLYVVFDTLRRNMRGGVSQEEAVAAVLNTVGSVQRLGIAVTLVAHHGRGHGETKGLTEWEDAADQVRHYEGTVRDNSTKIMFHKIKAGPDGWAIKVSYAKVELPNGVTTLTVAGGVEEIDTAAGKNANQWAPADARARQILDAHFGPDMPASDLARRVIEEELPDLVGEPVKLAKMSALYRKHLVGEASFASFVASRTAGGEASTFRNPAQNGRRAKRCLRVGGGAA